jgi:hypothetical protein
MDHGAGGVMPDMMSGEQMHQLGQASGEGFDQMFPADDDRPSSRRCHDSRN